MNSLCKSYRRQLHHHIFGTMQNFEIDTKIDVQVSFHYPWCMHIETNYFPAFMIQMIKTGETSGKLEIMLTKIADMYENDIQQQLTQLHKLLEPLIIVLLGVLIGGLVIGMYLPLFNLENLI